MKAEIWKNLNEVPDVFKELDGIRLELDQANLIYRDLALKHTRKRKDGRVDPNYAKARKLFREQFEVVQKGNRKIYLPGRAN